ncbi:hypothetical protein IFM89_020904 [Coptis chinensis]|uniref:Tumor necrosis factor receptor family protein n=1 Tax=Coptis chinensis TaxID=261450 RepID=A0A835HIZ9_9MAGN|nr:hypothetical protein IFM89_020904 [Coptis chinensis]
MFLRGALGGSSGGGGSGIIKLLVRHFSKKRAENVRKINPKVSPQEASTIAQSLYQVLKQHGPLTVSNTWTHAKEAGVDGLNSKTHLKLMLKWMRGRKMLKLFCHQVGSNKKFLHSTLPEEPSEGESSNSLGVKLETEKRPIKRKKISH